MLCDLMLVRGRPRNWKLKVESLQSRGVNRRERERAGSDLCMGVVEFANMDGVGGM